MTEFRKRKVGRREITYPIGQSTDTKSRYRRLSPNRLSSLERKELEMRAIGLGEMCVDIANKIDVARRENMPNSVIDYLEKQYTHNKRELDKVNEILRMGEK